MADSKRADKAGTTKPQQGTLDATYIVPFGKDGDTKQPSLDQSVPTLDRERDRGIPDDFGRYRIMTELGAGGMGQVFLAHDTQLDREVALKVPRIGRGNAAVDRFYREARSMASLRHPNICPVYDVGQHDGIHFLTMACIQGETLDDLLRDKNRAGEIDARKLVRALALALAEAHRAGVIHRDLKPANIMIDERNEPIVMDFGLARLERESEPHLTQDGSVLGTPAYMPPEQIEGRIDDIGPVSDVYSLGVVLFQLLTGKLPFEGSSVSVMAHILLNDPPAPSSICEVPGDMERICLKAMSRAEADRFQSMDELVQALDAAAVSFRNRGQTKPPAQSLVPGVQQDILVCCCPTDDDPPPGSSEGWVSTLLNNLKWRLRQLCGQPDAISVRIDSGGVFDEQWSDQLTQSVHESAIVMIVLSPGWNRSGWGTNAAAFYRALSDRLLADNRVIVVDREQVDPAARPSPILGVIPCSFWVDSPAGSRTLGYPYLDSNRDAEYYARIDDLARSIFNRLDALVQPSPASGVLNTANDSTAGTAMPTDVANVQNPLSGAGAESSTTDSSSEFAPTEAKAIHFAEVTDDLDPLREDVVRYVHQFEFSSLPAVWYSRDPAEFEQQLEADLRQSLVFVQLLGAFPGKRPPGMPLSYAQLQYNVAKRIGLPIFQWRSPALDIQSITDLDHRALVDSPSVQAVDIEDFKRDLLCGVRAEVKKRELQNAPPIESSDAFVFVNVDSDDLDIAETLCDLLERHGCSYAFPMLEGRPAEIREDLEANLLDCDAMIVVYGEITEQWVREQLRQWRKMQFRREKPVRVLAVYQGPPASKQRLGMKLPRMQVIDCREGLQESNLREFLEALASQ